ncbi:MAG: hypothetical protein GY909_11805 [Oligoflexia bacterium]|nr:hypothetical protein [Oligoflexia bacterium]
MLLLNHTINNYLVLTLDSKEIKLSYIKAVIRNSTYEVISEILQYLKSFKGVLSLLIPMIVFSLFGIGGLVSAKNLELSFVNKYWLTILTSFFLVWNYSRNVGTLNSILGIIIILNVFLLHGTADIDLIIANQLDLNSLGLLNYGLFNMPGTLILLLIVICNDQSKSTILRNSRDILLLTFLITIFFARDSIPLLDSYVLREELIVSLLILFFVIKFTISSIIVNYLKNFSFFRFDSISMKTIIFSVVVLCLIDTIVRVI